MRGSRLKLASFQRTARDLFTGSKTSNTLGCRRHLQHGQASVRQNHGQQVRELSGRIEHGVADADVTRLGHLQGRERELKEMTT